MSVRLNTVCQPCVAPNRDFASILKAGFNRRNANTGVKLRIEKECSICFGLLLPDFDKDTVFPDLTGLDESDLQFAAREVAVLSCGHTFHTQCLKRGSVRNCPVCNTALIQEDVAHLQSFNEILAEQPTRYNVLVKVQAEQLASNARLSKDANELNRLREEDRLRDLNDGGDVDGDYFDRLEQSQIEEEAKRQKKIEKRRAEKSRRADKKEQERAANAVKEAAENAARDAEAASKTARDLAKARETFQNVRDLFTYEGIVITLSSNRLKKPPEYSIRLESSNNTVFVSMVYPGMTRIIKAARITKRTSSNRLQCSITKDCFLMNNTENTLSFVLIAAKDVSFYTGRELDVIFPLHTLTFYGNGLPHPILFGFVPTLIYKNASNVNDAVNKTNQVAQIISKGPRESVPHGELSKNTTKLYTIALVKVLGQTTVESSSSDLGSFTMLVTEQQNKRILSVFHEGKMKFETGNPVFQFERVSAR